MPGITDERMMELLHLVLAILWPEPDGLYMRDILDQVEKSRKISFYEKGSFAFAPTFPRYEVIIRLGLVPLVKIGWLYKTKQGRWYYTDKGRETAKRYTNANDFINVALLEYEDRFKTQADQRIQANYLIKSEAQEKAWEQIVRHIQSMSAIEFRAMAGELLRTLGYSIIWMAPQYKNRGKIDFIVGSRSIGTGKSRILVHVIHTDQQVSIESVQAFNSLLGSNDQGVLITSNGFASTVQKEEHYIKHYQKISLIDFDIFFELWVKNYKKLSQEAREFLPLTSVYFLSQDSYL